MVDFTLFDGQINKLKKIDELKLTAIDIGSPAIDRGWKGLTARTTINKGGTATGTGKITSIEIWADSDLSDVEVATFFIVSGTNFSTRDHEVIGAVTAGAKRTFIVDLDVQIGDYIGIYMTAGQIEMDTAGGTGLYEYVAGDAIPCTNTTFTLIGGGSYVISLYGTGETVAPADFEYVGTGTFTYSGTATQSHTKGFVYVTSGEFTYSGAAECSYQVGVDFEYTGSGQFIFSGIAPQSYTNIFSYSGSGDLTYSGEATISYIPDYLYTASGVFTYSGEAECTYTIVLYEYIGIGVFAYSGYASYICEYFYTKVDKDIADYSKVEKETATYTKVHKPESDYAKKDG
ncbi:hypothetical protein ES705_47853 [subsurface metagenome]